MMQKRFTKLTDAWICQVEDRRVVPVFGDLIVEQGKIVAIQKKNFGHFLNRETAAKAEGEISVDGRVVTLPLVNFHDHFYSRLAKGLPIAGQMDNFIDILENLWWKLDLHLDEKMIRASARMAILEALQQGVTTIFDHHSSPGVAEKSLAIIAAEMEKFGLRGALCFETTDRNGKKLAQRGLEANIDFLNKETENLKGMLGLHASFTLENDTLQEAGEIVKHYNCGIHIHLCEDRADGEISRQKFGASPIERLEKYGLLNPNSLLAHGIHLSPSDYETLKNSGAALVYNPDSNLNNSVGLPQYSAVPHEIPILPGTDGMHANIARTLKQLFLLYRSQNKNPDEAFAWLQKLYFDQLIFVRRFFPDFPALQPGDRADFIVWDYFPPTPLNQETFWGHFIYGILERPVFLVSMQGNLIQQNSVIKNYLSSWKEIHLQGARLYEKFCN